MNIATVPPPKGWHRDQLAEWIDLTVGLDSSLVPADGLAFAMPTPGHLVCEITTYLTDDDGKMVLDGGTAPPRVVALTVRVQGPIE